jgi:tetratricopeptide (TPR) repeat protein
MKLLHPLRLGLLFYLLASLPLSAQTTAKKWFDSAEGKILHGDYDGAIADYDQAIALDPKDARAYINRGAAKKGKGDFDSAIADFDKAMALIPKYPTFYHIRGGAKQAKGDLDAAISDYDQAIVLNPDDASTYTDRGSAKQAKGDFDGALADFDKAITLAKDNTGYSQYARFHRDFLQRRLHRGDTAADLAKTVAKWNDGWPKTIGLYLSNALPEKDFLAQTTQSDAQTVRAQQCEAYYFIGTTKLLAGDTAAAREFFGKCLATNATYGSAFIELSLARAEFARLADRK